MFTYTVIVASAVHSSMKFQVPIWDHFSFILKNIIQVLRCAGLLAVNSLFFYMKMYFAFVLEEQFCQVENYRLTVPPTLFFPFQFSIVAVPNYHKLSDIKQCIFFFFLISGSRKSKIDLSSLKSRSWQCYVPSRDSRRNSASLPLQLLETAQKPGPVIKASNIRLGLCCFHFSCSLFSAFLFT